MGLREWLARRIGRGIARTQLHIFENLRKSYPDATNEVLFAAMLRGRPGWSDDRIEEFLSEEGSNPRWNGSLLEFIEKVIFNEYAHRLPVEDLAQADLGAADYLKKQRKLLYAKREGLAQR